uniref:Uncharacterized protein n=1 Tax=Vespula pensylvanica TaxID=30213 RepID=A0A834NR96_VESPE|nr:hypothetical protein H0235_011072 [Vespula pensylvanica]
MSKRSTIKRYNINRRCLSTAKQRLTSTRISCDPLDEITVRESYGKRTEKEALVLTWASPTCTLRLFRMKLADDEARFVALFSSSSPFSMTTTTTMTTNDDDDDDESVSQERADVPQARRRQTDCHAKT